MGLLNKKKQTSDSEELSEFNNRGKTLPLPNKPFARSFLATGIVVSSIYAIARLLLKTKGQNIPFAYPRQLTDKAFIHMKGGLGTYKSAAVVGDLYSGMARKFKRN